MPMRGFLLACGAVAVRRLVLILVIVIESDQLRTSAVKGGRDIALQCPDAAARRPYQSKRLDVGLLAQAGDPAFLNLLRFLLDQFFLDIGPRFVE